MVETKETEKETIDPANNLIKEEIKIEKEIKSQEKFEELYTMRVDKETKSE